MKCYNYEPHFHEERLERPFPRTPDDSFIFVCDMGDIAFAQKDEILRIIDRLRQFPDRRFLLQSKDPECFRPLVNILPPNVFIDTTIETNRDAEYQTHNISKAPLPSKRYETMKSLLYDRKWITIEPILDFDVDILFQWIIEIKPLRVYIGYDTKDCGLPEPPMIKTMELIKRLRNAGIDVREKTMRPMIS